MPIVPVTVVDDDDVAITVDAKKADADGDIGFVLSIANKTDGKVYVYAAHGWKVNGSDVDDAVLRAVVEAGQTTEEFMWFDRGWLGVNTLDDLKGVEGVIVVEDYDTSAIVGEYAFKA